MLQTLLSTALLLAPTAPNQDPADALFPPASGPLTIEVDENGDSLSYYDLLTLYGELTGQHVAFGLESQQVTQNHLVRLDRPMTVPASEVQLFVESMLEHGHYVLHPLKSSGARIVSVTSLATAARNNLRSNALYIAEDQLETARRHPAVLFMTTLSLPHMDVRQVANSMRTMITDANTQQLLPVGASNSIAIVGFGDQLAATADMLRAADAAAAREAAPPMEVEVVRLEKATASELAALLDRAVGGPRPAPPLPGQAASATVPASRLVQVHSDERTNSLLISGPRDRIAAIKELIALLDV